MHLSSALLGPLRAGLTSLALFVLFAFARGVEHPRAQRNLTEHSSRRITLGELVTKAVNHFEHHLKFMHTKRAAMGKEMW